MSNSRRSRVRALARVLAYAVGAALLAFLCFLPFAGRYLVLDQPLVKADAIVVLAGPRVERWMEGVELFREGWAPRVVLSPGRIEEAETRLRAGGIRFPAEADLVRDAMIQLRVPPAAIVVLPTSLDNTAAEAGAIRDLATRSGWRRLIVVTSNYHTRRTAFAFSREMAGTGVDLIVRGTRHEKISPDRWWMNRGDARWVSSELQKLMAYRLGLGI
jgi:uncharacterized SAM-binding protein YcdF (DUF218 family)